jgi:hypothetical protein
MDTQMIPKILQICAAQSREHIWLNRRATTETIDLQTAIHRYQEFLKTDQYAYDTLGYSDEDAAIFEAAWKLTKRNENKLKQGT